MKFERWGADDPGVIFAKPQELGSKNLYAYCDNNPVAREDYVGEFPIPCIVGAVVGAAVSGFSYVLTRGGEIDGEGNLKLSVSSLRVLVFISWIK